MAARATTRTINGFVIETGIPAPSPGGRGRGTKWPFGDMAIDETVFIERGKYADLTTAVTSICSALRRYPDMKFTTQRDRENDGVRVWRIA